MNEGEEAVTLRENFFKETDLRRSPCHRRTGPFLHPVFIFLSVFFLSILLVRLSPEPILLVVRNFFHSKVEIIGFLFPCFAPSSSVSSGEDIHPWLTVEKCQSVPFRVRYGDLFPRLECVFPSLSFPFMLLFIFVSPASNHYCKELIVSYRYLFLTGCFHWRRTVKIFPWLLLSFFLFMRLFLIGHCATTSLRIPAFH